MAHGPRHPARRRRPPVQDRGDDYGPAHRTPHGTAPHRDRVCEALDLVDGLLAQPLLPVDSIRAATGRAWLLLVLPGVGPTTALDAFHATVDLIDEVVDTSLTDIDRVRCAQELERHGYANSLSPDHYP